MDEKDQRIDEAITKMMAARKEREQYHEKEADSAKKVDEVVTRMRGIHAKSLLRYNGGMYWGGASIAKHPQVVLNCIDLERILLFREQLIAERLALIEAGQRMAAMLEEVAAGNGHADMALVRWEQAKVKAWASER